MIKPREFQLKIEWYDCRVFGFYKTYCEPQPDEEQTIQVIEKSAYDKAVEALKDIADGAHEHNCIIAQETLTELGVN